MCRRCRKDPLLIFSRASVFDATEAAFQLARARPDLLAAFAVHQWAQLDWPVPDVVIPIGKAKKIAQMFAEMIERPYANILKRKERWECDDEAIDEDLVILLIDDHSPMPECQNAIGALTEASPKKGYLLSLFHYDTCHS